MSDIISYKQHFVAFMDILGFKNIINTSSFEKVLSVFQSIITDNQAAVALKKAVDDVDDISYDTLSLNTLFLVKAWLMHIWHRKNMRFIRE